MLTDFLALSRAGRDRGKWVLVPLDEARESMHLARLRSLAEKIPICPHPAGPEKRLYLDTSCPNN